MPPQWAWEGFCGAFLREMGRRIEDRFFFTPAWSVDVSWQTYDPSGPYWGVNRWFQPPGESFSITEHNGVKVGVVVAGFHDPAAAPQPHRVLPRRNGATLREGLEACLAAGCDKVYVEGATGWEEQTLILDTEAWGTRELDTIRAVREAADMANVDPILDADLRGGHWTYQRLVTPRAERVRLLTEIEDAIRRGVREHSGMEPSEEYVGHVLHRGWVEQERWHTYRRAIHGIEAPPVPGPDPEPEPEPEEDGVKIIVHEDTPGAAFEYQTVLRFVPKADTAKLSSVFQMDIDNGDLLAWQRSGQTDADWEHLVRRMLRRAA